MINGGGEDENRNWNRLVTIFVNHKLKLLFFLPWTLWSKSSWSSSTASKGVGTYKNNNPELTLTYYRNWLYITTSLIISIITYVLMPVNMNYHTTGVKFIIYLILPKRPLGKLFSKVMFKSPAAFCVLWN